VRKVLLLVEGQSEEIVVRDVLGPHFLARGVCLQATLVTTKREKSGLKFRGGISTFAKVERTSVTY
jgi:hypothetical protein